MKSISGWNPFLLDIILTAFFVPFSSSTIFFFEPAWPALYTASSVAARVHANTITFVIMLFWSRGSDAWIRIEIIINLWLSHSRILPITLLFYSFKQTGDLSVWSPNCKEYCNSLYKNITSLNWGCKLSDVSFCQTSLLDLISNNDTGQLRGVPRVFYPI